MRRSNRLLSIIILLAIIGLTAWLFVPSASSWIEHNLTVLLTIAAIIILAFVIIRFVLEKVNTASRRTVDIALVVIALGCLFWIYAVPRLPVWIRQNGIPIILTIAAICVVSVVAWKVIDRMLTRSSKRGKKVRIPIPIETQRLVFARANNRCQWKSCKVTANLEIHHIDNNPANNNVHNLICLCPNHHKRSQRKEKRAWLLRDWAHGRY